MPAATTPPARLLELACTGVLCALLLVPFAHGQTITIDEARNQGVGADVTVEGTVTRAFGDFVRFQDGSGPTGASGLVVHQTSGDFHDAIQDGTITQGTELQASGTLSQFPESGGGILQINEGDLDDYTVKEQGDPPAPQDVTLADLRTSDRDYESELVRVTSLDFLNPQGTFGADVSYPVLDTADASTLAGSTLTFRVQDSGETQIVGESIPVGSFDYTGVVGRFNSQAQLIPVQSSDVQPVRSFGVGRQFAQAEEDSGTVEVDVKAFATESGDDVSATATVGTGSTADAGDVGGFSGSETFTFSGDDPPPQTLSLDPIDDGTDEGVERLEVVLESSDGAIARPQRFTLWLLDAPAVQTTIAAGDSGDALIDALQQQFGNPRPLGYDLARDSMYARIYNDETNTVEGTYSGFQITVDPSEGDPSAIAADKGINTEHTWPQSKGAGQEPARSDLHILVPTRQQVNSARSNLPFGESPDTDTDTWYFEDQTQSSPPEADRPLWSELLSGQKFEPRHSVKGNVARAAFYFVTIYPNRANFSFFDAQRDTLLAWHERDPVDATEMRRNLTQAGYQDNALNPFVLDATLADRAYGSGADAGDNPPPTTGTFELFANGLDIDPGSGNVDAQCLVQPPSSGDLVFFNAEEGGIFVWNGSSLSTHRSASDLNSDIPDEPDDFDRCDGMTMADGFVYFILRKDGPNDNYVYRTEAADPSNNAFSQFNGANALAADANTVFIGSVAGLGGDVNGVFEISSDLSGSATEVASDENVNSGSMDLAPNGTLYGFSTSFGSDPFSGTVFSVDVSASSPSIDVFTNPYSGNSPLTPDPEFGGGIDDLQFIDFEGTSYLAVSNGGGSEQEWGTIEVDSESVELLFEQADLEANLGVGGYDAFTAPLAVNSDGEVFAASGGNGGPDYIAKVSEAPPLPVEFAGFDAVRGESSVELTWQTASETNNAGFRVQHQAPDAESWNGLGFVESEASGDTTTESVSYRYAVERELEAGTHRFRLKQKDLDGSTSFSDVVTVDVTMDGALSLSAPVPNPVTETATISFGVREATETTMSVYNVLGQHVKTLYQGTPPQAGEMNEVTFDADAMPSGVYFVRMRADGQTRTERLTVVR